MPLNAHPNVLPSFHDYNTLRYFRGRPGEVASPWGMRYESLRMDNNLKLKLYEGSMVCPNAGHSIPEKTEPDSSGGHLYLPMALRATHSMTTGPDS